MQSIQTVEKDWSADGKIMKDPFFFFFFVFLKFIRSVEHAVARQWTDMGKNASRSMATAVHSLHSSTGLYAYVISCTEIIIIIVRLTPTRRSSHSSV